MAGYRRPDHSRNERIKPGLIIAVIAATAALIAIAALIISVIRSSDGSDRVVYDPASDGGVMVDVLTDGLATATPEPTPEPTPTPAPTPVNYGIELPKPTEAGYLPIVRQADTDKKIIAITVDDCNQFSNTRQIIDCAIENGGKITLFPIGKNVLNTGFHDILRYAYDNGMQIENHTQEHLPHYQLTDEELARQYGLQDLCVDYVLGVDYQQHFVRPMGGNGRDDQRLHIYCDQMGVKAIAHWNVSGGLGLSDLGASLAPGNIYLFHTTDKDLEKLLKFIPYAVSQGYELVTLNEMFGLPENEVRPLEGEVTADDVMPFEPYVLNPRTYKEGDYAWVAYLVQARLIQLDYLGGEPDGIYGEGTAKAVSKFQKDNGLEPTGEADIETQRLLFKDYPQIEMMLFGETSASAETPVPESTVEALEPEYTVEPENTDNGN